MPNGRVAPGKVWPWPPVPMNTSTWRVRSACTRASAGKAKLPAKACAGLACPPTPNKARAMALCRNPRRVGMHVSVVHSPASERRNRSNVAQQMRLALRQIDNQFAEQAVRPGEPITGELRRIVLIEGFVHETGI